MLRNNGGGGNFGFAQEITPEPNLITTETPFSTETPSPTATLTETPTATLTETPALTNTAFFTETATETPFITETATETAFFTETATATFGETETPSLTPAETLPAGMTETPTATFNSFATEENLTLALSDDFQNGAGNWRTTYSSYLSMIDSNFVLAFSTDSASAKLKGFQSDTVVAEIQVLLPQFGRFHLNIREISNEQHYAAVLDAAGTVELHRNGIPLSSVNLQNMADGLWHTLNISAIENLVRITIDNNEIISFVDSDPLSAGQVSLRGTIPNGDIIFVDNFRLWRPFSQIQQSQANTEDALQGIDAETNMLGLFNVPNFDGTDTLLHVGGGSDISSIYSRNGDGSNLFNWSTTYIPQQTSYSVYNPTISPDGIFIAFNALGLGGNLTTLNVLRTTDGNLCTLLTMPSSMNISDIAWFQTSTTSRIYFTSNYKNGNFNADGNYEVMYFGLPCNQGQQILPTPYTTSNTSNFSSLDVRNVNNQPDIIHVVNGSAGSGVYRNNTFMVALSYVNRELIGISWADGDNIVYSRSEANPDVYNLYHRSITGGIEIAITTDVTSGFGNFGPDWTHDENNNQIIFYGHYNPVVQFGGIYRINFPQRNNKQLIIHGQGPSASDPITIGSSTGGTPSPEQLATLFPLPMQSTPEARLSDLLFVDRSNRNPPLCSRDINAYGISGGNYPIIASANGQVYIKDLEIPGDDNIDLGNFVALIIKIVDLDSQVKSILRNRVANPNISTLINNDKGYILIGYGHLLNVNVGDVTFRTFPPISINGVIGQSGKTGIDDYPIEPDDPVNPKEHLDISLFYISGPFDGNLINNPALGKYSNPTIQIPGNANPVNNYFAIFRDIQGIGDTNQYGLIELLDPLILWPLLAQNITSIDYQCP